ncbi:MAG: hypothetical protein OJF51_000105 [Nitrospira sp.]|nr:MAG: hypothetical protein OJF51_000105 [Nitrospira sp.]
MRRTGFVRGCVMLVALTSMMGCTGLTPQDPKYYSSRLYDLPYERVFNAVHARVAEYPMGVRQADQTKGIVKSRIGGTTPGIETSGGYQVTVAVSQVGNRTRVTPDWKKTASSAPTNTYLLPISIDERPQLYTEFFDELDKHLQY